jgi:hypothetical protein
MNRQAMLASAVLVLAAACGGSDSPTSPTPTAQPTTIVFTSQLSAANEVPPITNADANGRGTATITFNLTRDAAGAITAANANFVYSLNSFPAGTVVRASHIHTGATGIGGGVLIDTLLSPANAVTLASDGTGTLTFSNVPMTTLADVNAVIANPAGYYFNVHTNLNPGGAVRGQLVRQ